MVSVSKNWGLLNFPCPLLWVHYTEDEAEAGEVEAEDEAEAGEEAEAEDESEAEIEAEEESESVCDVEAEEEAEDIRESEEVESEELLADDVSLLDDFDAATPSSADLLSDVPEEEIRFNTGNQEFSIVSQEDFFEKEIGDAYFEEDGSFTINIPEVNPFFPYEVQFTQNGKVTSEWFMTPDDSIEIDGHVFYVSAYFDGSAVTQMNLDVAGDIITVYPKEKSFTDGGGFSFFSLLPLEERELEIDLSGYTPAELTMVSVDTIFAGDMELEDTDKIIWTLLWEDNYTVSDSGDVLDLSYRTESGDTTWEMIVGDDDQLASANIRYIIDLIITESENWVVPTVYTQNEEGVRTSVTVLNSYYEDWSDREFYIDVPGDETEDIPLYLNLEINDSVYSDKLYDQIRIYEGQFKSAKDAMAGTEITDQVFDSDMGYLIERYSDIWITMVTFGSDGQVTGCLPFIMHVHSVNNSLSRSLYTDSEDGRTRANSESERVKNSDGSFTQTFTLYEGYDAEQTCYLVMNYYTYDQVNPDAVTAAYVGNYMSIADAEKKRAENILLELFDDSGSGGYAADYSDGVWITVFVGEDGSESQEIYRYLVKTQEGSKRKYEDIELDFSGLYDADHRRIDTYFVDEEEDSYADYNYLTMLVDEDVDLSCLAPGFWIGDDELLYAEGSSTPEISGESLHDFSNGPVQYTLSSKDGKQAKNYWLHVIQATDGTGNLYINSLSDENADTIAEEGIIYSTREMFLDGRYEYIHDMLLINTGKEPIAGLLAELVSDQVELDVYWNLSGEYELPGFTGIDDGVSSYGELANMVKLRFRAKEDAVAGSDISGTLTLKSAGEVLMVLTLTGTVGDPSIITTEIPQAVKYVPYGTMIQNSNKYDWNTPSYELVKGKLPNGMTVKQNGEIYGVPTESGTFTFTVSMENSEADFSDSRKTYTLIVTDNTDANVDAATDQGYELTQRVRDITVYDSADQTLVSEGIYGEFEDIFLDGEKLKEGEDYTSESGSTRITIRSQTLRGSGQTGVHTLGVEFRTGEERTLKRAAQNYRVVGYSADDKDSDSESSSNTSSDHSSGSRSQKGYMNSDAGLVTGTGNGYAKWSQDDKGWKLVYADGTTAAGHMFTLEDGTLTEQIVWEKVNSHWFAFGADGYLKSGWVNDYQLGSWYWVSVDYGMRSGWYNDPQDGYTYYLEPETGKIVTGWKQIDGKWYYFNEITPEPTWLFDAQKCVWYYDILSKNKPYGSMYCNEKTPDGYQVGVDGAWIK